MDPWFLTRVILLCLSLSLALSVDLSLCVCLSSFSLSHLIPIASSFDNDIPLQIFDLLAKFDPGKSNFLDETDFERTDYVGESAVATAFLSHSISLSRS